MNGVGGVLRQGLVSINNLIELEILDQLHQKLKNLQSNFIESFLRLGSKYTLDVWSIKKPLGLFLLPSSGNNQACVDEIDPGVVGNGVVVSSIHWSNCEVWKTFEERFVVESLDL